MENRCVCDELHCTLTFRSRQKCSAQDRRAGARRPGAVVRCMLYMLGSDPGSQAGCLESTLENRHYKTTQF